MAETIYKVTECGVPLSIALAKLGCRLALRCGGTGACGRCSVRLLSGVWRCRGKMLAAPAVAPGCRTELVSGVGRVAVPGTALAELDCSVVPSWNAAPVSATPGEFVAVDLGTTTVEAVRICDGRVTDRSAFANLQEAFGDNVVARIAAAGTHLEALRAAAAESINAALDSLHCSAPVRLALAGNTVMSCLLHGIDPTPLGSFPFTLPVRTFSVRAGGELGLHCSAPVYTLPPVSAYVGGDVTAGMLETALRPGEMLIDIGTNCEIVFRAEEREWICTAAAAGPAFEGAGIGCGTRARKGAVTRWFAPGRFQTLGGISPDGACASALIDVLAWARKARLLDRFGRIADGQKLEFIPGLRLSDAEIAALLSAKAAVRAGISALEKEFRLAARKIYLAGNFALHLDLAHAIAVGMLPPGREYVRCGNLSLAGAARAACEPSSQLELERLAALPRELPMNDLKTFAADFADAMLLP